MANDIKSGIGYIIPATSVVGFFTALFQEEALASIIIAIGGILLWFIYMLVMESHIPTQMGNMIILFGVMLSLGIFLGFGIDQHLHGGYNLKPEGLVFSLIILFFAIITGLNFRNQQTSSSISNENTGGLSVEDRKLVLDAINKSKSKSVSNNNTEPRVIVVKQESSSVEDKIKPEQLPPSQNPYDPYLMANNPYFAYPPDYYYDDDDDDEYEEDWDEYEYEDD